MSTMYHLLEEGNIATFLKDGSRRQLPPENNGTPEWAEYQAWLAEGNTPESAPAPPAPVELTAPEETVLIRARHEDGTYKADDPSTPENEAYIEVPLSEA